MRAQLGPNLCGRRVRTGRIGRTAVQGVERIIAGMAVAMQAEGRDEAQCWCCGVVANPAQLVELGNHPEVRICPRCATWLAKRAWELEDRGRGGPLVFARNRFRVARRTVV